MIGQRFINEALSKRLTLLRSSSFVLSNVYCITASFLAYVELQLYSISQSLGNGLILVEICLKPLKENIFVLWLSRPVKGEAVYNICYGSVF